MKMYRRKEMRIDPVYNIVSVNFFHKVNTNRDITHFVACLSANPPLSSVGDIVDERYHSMWKTSLNSDIIKKYYIIITALI